MFMAVTQSCETLFDGAAELRQRAAEAVDYADAAHAEFNLHMAARILASLQSAGRPLSAMTVTAWLDIRPAIVDPSAIQSHNFQTIRTLLRGLPRRMAHDRYRATERQRLPAVFDALENVVEAVRRWSDQHFGFAHRYAAIERGAPLPENLAYLKKRDHSWLSAVDEEIREVRQEMCGSVTPLLERK
jgi:tryptophan 2,3-dioxygenase